MWLQWGYKYSYDWDIKYQERPSSIEILPGVWELVPGKAHKWGMLR